MFIILLLNKYLIISVYFNTSSPRLTKEQKDVQVFGGNVVHNQATEILVSLVAVICARIKIKSKPRGPRVGSGRVRTARPKIPSLPFPATTFFPPIFASVCLRHFALEQEMEITVHPFKGLFFIFKRLEPVILLDVKH